MVNLITDIHIDILSAHFSFLKMVQHKGQSRINGCVSMSRTQK